MVLLLCTFHLSFLKGVEVKKEVNLYCKPIRSHKRFILWFSRERDIHEKLYMRVCICGGGGLSYILG